MQSILVILCVFTFLKQIYCVIYYLNETEYNRMPPIYHLDDYNVCLQNPTDQYCSISFSLVSDEPSELLTLIKEYSEHVATHYNHTKLRYGLCVTQNCSNVQKDKTVSKESLEVCLNNTMWRNYKLKTKIKNLHCYTQADNKNSLDTSDIIVAAVVLGIIMLNIIGSLRDKGQNSEKKPNFLSCFSLSRNWKKLTASNNSLDKIEQNLKGLNGLRCIILVGMVMVHVYWPSSLTSKNTRDLELNYYNIFQYFFYNGSIVLQTNLLITGFLLSYKMEIYSEKATFGWGLVPKGILMRYFRLTPVYATAIALMATWLKFAGPGPLWDVSGKMVRSQCRSRWWQNILYINNYTYDTQCLPQAWYLGVDMQMYCIGIITCVALRNKDFAYRRMVLILLFIIGLILPAVHTYIRDLDAHVIITPGQSRNLFITDPTFNETYKTGHSNMSSFIVGLALGYLVYNWQKKSIDLEVYKKYQYIYWGILPLVSAVVLSGSVFYRDAPRDPLYIRVLYSALAKPTFGILMAIFITGMIFKLDDVYRQFLELDIWTIPSRLSYCVYIIHMPYMRLYISLKTTLLTFSNTNTITILVLNLIVSFITAVPMWLLVEAPFTELSKYFSTSTSNNQNGTIVNSQSEKTDNKNAKL